MDIAPHQRARVNGSREGDLTERLVSRWRSISATLGTLISFLFILSPSRAANAAECLPGDSDDDSIPNSIEDANRNLDCDDDDTDSDGTFDYLDTDDDGDGILTLQEGGSFQLDSDKDGTFNYLDTDDDGDGVITATEAGTCSTGDCDDTDKDGIFNYLDTDDDGDGIPTLTEGAGDTDGDGIPDYLDTTSGPPQPVPAGSALSRGLLVLGLGWTWLRTTLRGRKD